MPQYTPVHFRKISADQHAVDSRTASGRKLRIRTAAGHSGTFELLATRSIHTAAPFSSPCTIGSRNGLLALDDPMLFFSLLSGVPAPARDASEAEKRQRLVHSLARLPPCLSTVFGHCYIENSTDLESNAVELILTVSRDDIHIYARARASRYLWLEVFNAMDASTVHTVDINDTAELNYPVEFGRGTFPARDIQSLRKDAVLILKDTHFDRTGVGLIPYGKSVAHTHLKYLDARQVLSVLSIEYPIVNIKSSLANPMTHDNDPEMYDNQDDDEESLEDSFSGYEKTNSSVDVAGVSIRLIAEIGHIHTTIGNLKSFAPGAYAIIEGRANREVTLRIDGGAVFAYAEIVEIEGRLGLQIKQVVA